MNSRNKLVVRLTYAVCFLTALPVISLKSQHTIIKGTLIEKSNNLPLEYASVALLSNLDSSVIAGTTTNAKGDFLLAKVDSGDYIGQIVFLGFKTKYIQLSVSKNSKEIDLAYITMESSTDLLKEITVTGNRINSTNKLDKQTYSADQFESSKGGSAIDALKNLPSVAVNSAGEISIRGSTGFLILINGKPMVTDAQTILSQLPANTIENIELITAPSSKYDADGKAGILNIVTRQGVDNGLAIIANLQGGLPSTTDFNNLEKPSRFGGDFTINFKQNKWDLSLSANYLRNDGNGRREGDVFTKNFINHTITRFPSLGERSFDRYSYGARTSINYSSNKNNVFNLGIFASKKYQQRRADIEYANSTSDLTTNTLLRQLNYFNSNLQTKEGEFLVGSLDYAHTFHDKSTLSASALYEHANLIGSTLNKNINLPDKNMVFQQVINPYTNPISGYRFKLDHSISIGTGKLESGYQFRSDHQDGKFDYEVTPNVPQSDISKFRGTAKSTNHINALYSQYGGKLSELQYVAGLRYEYASREVILSSDTNHHHLDQSNLFPSINLLFPFKETWNLKGGYSKRVQRNNNFELNPIPEREHSETLEQGDPDLLPQYVDLAEFGINHDFNKGSFFSTLYFQHIKNPIQRVNNVYADSILNRLFTNASSARLIGLEMGSTTNFGRWLTLYMGANLYNYKISGELNVLGETSTINNSNWVYSLNVNTTTDLGKEWSWQVNANYVSARPTAQGEDSRFLSPNTSLKKSFLDGKLSLSLQWQNINLGFMNANQQRITTYGTDFYTTTNYIYETDVFLLNFNFKLNKINSKTKLPTSEIGEKEF